MESESCVLCRDGSVDDVKHSFEDCASTQQYRNDFQRDARIPAPITCRQIVDHMLKDEIAWKQGCDFAAAIIRLKDTKFQQHLRSLNPTSGDPEQPVSTSQPAPTTSSTTAVRNRASSRKLRFFGRFISEARGRLLEFFCIGNGLSILNGLDVCVGKMTRKQACLDYIPANDTVLRQIEGMNIGEDNVHNPRAHYYLRKLRFFGRFISEARGRLLEFFCIGNGLSILNGLDVCVGKMTRKQACLDYILANDTALRQIEGMKIGEDNVHNLSDHDLLEVVCTRSHATHRAASCQAQARRE